MGMGMEIGDWGLGIGDLAHSPFPNPQSPIPNPHFFSFSSKNKKIETLFFIFIK